VSMHFGRYSCVHIYANALYECQNESHEDCQNSTRIEKAGNKKQNHALIGELNFVRQAICRTQTSAAVLFITACNILKHNSTTRPRHEQNQDSSNQTAAGSGRQRPVDARFTCNTVEGESHTLAKRSRGHLFYQHACNPCKLSSCYDSTADGCRVHCKGARRPIRCCNSLSKSGLSYKLKVVACFWLINVAATPAARPVLHSIG